MFTSLEQSSTFDSVCEAGESSPNGRLNGLNKVLVPKGILPQLPGSKAYTSTSSTCEPSSSCNTSRFQTSVSFLTNRANNRVGEYEEISRKHRSPESQGNRFAKRSPKHGHEQGTSSSNTDKASAEFQRTLAGIFSLLGSEGNSETITISSGDQRADEWVKNGGYKYYKVPLPARPVQIRFEIVKRPPSALVNMWASTDEDRPSARNCQLKARDDAIAYQHILPESIGVVPGGSAPPCDALYVCVEGTTEATYDVRVVQGPVKIQFCVQAMQQKRQNAKQSNVVEQKIQELQKNAAKRQEFDEDLAQRKRKKAEERNKNDLQLRNAREAVTGTRLSKLDSQRISALNRTRRQEQVNDKRAQHLESLYERRIMWVQREQTRREEREEQQRIREEAEAIDSRGKYWLSSLSLVSFAVNIGQRYKAMLEAIAQREKETHAAGKIGAEFLKFWSVHRRKKMYENIMMIRAGLVAIIRQTNLCTFFWAGPIIAEFMATRVGDQSTSGNVTMQVKIFVLKIRRTQCRWRRIKTVRNARVDILREFFREMEHTIIEKRKKAIKRSAEQASATPRTPDERLSFPGGRATISGNIQAASRGLRGSLRKRATNEGISEETEQPQDTVLLETMPDHVVQDALYAYIVRRQRQHYDDVKKWHEQIASEQFDRDLRSFTMTEDEDPLKNNPKPSPLEACLVKQRTAQYNQLFQVVEETRTQWENQLLKDLQSQPHQLYRSPTSGPKRRASTDY